MNPILQAQNLWDLWQLDPRLKIWVIVFPAVAISSYLLVYGFYWMAGGNPTQEEGLAESNGQRAFFPAVILSILVCVALRFYVNPSRLSALSGNTRTTERARPAEVRVWINKQVYYCPGAKAYGLSKPGMYMSEPEAIQKGYHSNSHHTCAQFPSTPKGKSVDRRAPAEPKTPHS